MRVTVNSGDPTFFGASLVDELALCLTTLGFGLRELARMAETAAEVAFVDEPARAGLRERVRQGWATLR